jgi:hypothetical protein
MLVANTSYHWGMKQETTTSTEKIYSAGSSKSPAGMLMTKELGTSSGRYVLVYKNNSDSKKATAHFVPNNDDIVNSVKEKATYKQANVKDATVKTTTKKWVWKSDNYRRWLKVGKTQNQLISKKHVVTVPKDTWAVLTADQAKKLAKAQKSVSADQQASQQNVLKQTLQSSLAEYSKKNPNATKKELQEYTQTETAKLSVQAINQMAK